jgi:hypothetical protein
LENSNENWKIIPQKYFENIGENFLIFSMNLDSFKSLENELTKNILAFYKEFTFLELLEFLLNLVLSEFLSTVLGLPFSKYLVQISSFVCFLIWL